MVLLNLLVGTALLLLIVFGIIQLLIFFLFAASQWRVGLSDEFDYFANGGILHLLLWCHVLWNICVSIFRLATSRRKGLTTYYTVCDYAVLYCVALHCDVWCWVVLVVMCMLHCDVYAAL
jgi:hypothetical protein